MPFGITTKTASLLSMAAELAYAAPLVAAHRMTRMALSGPFPSEHDVNEFQRMGDEKGTAFSESWNAMVMQTLWAQQAFLLSFWFPVPSVHAAFEAAVGIPRTALAVAHEGLAPVHRTTMANIERLGLAPAAAASER